MQNRLAEYDRKAALVGRGRVLTLRSKESHARPARSPAATPARPSDDGGGNPRSIRRSEARAKPRSLRQKKRRGVVPSIGPGAVVKRNKRQALRCCCGSLSKRVDSHFFVRCELFLRGETFLGPHSFASVMQAACGTRAP